MSLYVRSELRRASTTCGTLSCADIPLEPRLLRAPAAAALSIFDYGRRLARPFRFCWKLGRALRIESRWRARQRLLLRAGRIGGCGHTLSISSKWRRGGISRSRIAISAGRSAWAIGSGRSSRIPWTDREWRGQREEIKLSTKCTSARSRAKARGSAATAQLAELARAGITVLEVMPVADFAGRFGWGYDGVDLFAPTRCTARPTTCADSSIAPMRVGIGVILDVVYNHFGPDGNYLKQFSPEYFTDRYENDWGEAINFDGPDSRPGARVLHRERRLLDRRISSRWPAAGRDATDLRSLRRSHSSRELREQRAKCGGGADDL